MIHADDTSGGAASSVTASSPQISERAREGNTLTAPLLGAIVLPSVLALGLVLLAFGRGRGFVTGGAIADAGPASSGSSMGFGVAWAAAATSARRSWRGGKMLLTGGKKVTVTAKTTVGGES